MNPIISTAARRTVVSTLAAFVLATALPQFGFAQTVRVTGEQGVWKLNLAKSKFGPRWNTIIIERDVLGKLTSDAKPSQTASPLLVVSNRKVYLATASGTSGASSGSMKFVQVGDSVRRDDYCRLGCQLGDRDRSMTVTFRGVDSGGQTISNVLAYNKR